MLSQRERVLADPRIRRLTDDCGIGRAFNEDTSDLVPVLVSKLEMGMLEPLQMATRELARASARPQCPSSSVSTTAPLPLRSSRVWSRTWWRSVL